METNSSEQAQASPERNPPFKDLKRKVQAYLSDPKSEDPYLDVNNYFTKIKDPKKIAEETHSLLYDTRNRLLNPRSLDYDPRYGSPGTIVMRLPYFYPLHLTLFSQYVDASLETAKGLSDQDKEALVKKISENAVIYGLIPDEAEKVRSRLKSFFPPSKRDNALAPPTNKSSGHHWYKTLNPFKRK